MIRGNRIAKILTLAFVAIVAAPALATIRYVNIARPDDLGDGTTWATAKKSLQAALALYNEGDQIWVVAGTYKPDQGSGVTPGDRNATFQLPDFLFLLGGFAGGETSEEQRDWVTNVTVLSGDLNGDDLPNFGNYGDNSYHVVTGSGAVGGEVHGFTIRGGNADAPGHEFGGGLLTDSGAPFMWYCRFEANYAQLGGAMANLNSSATVVQDCTFIGNSASNGGAVYNHSSNPIFVYCPFLANTAGNGAGMSNFLSSPFVGWCSFNDNVANVGGGAISHETASDMTVRNTYFYNNVATISGAGAVAILGDPGLNVDFFDCMFLNNRVSTASGSGGAISFSNCALSLTNCRLHQNQCGVSARGGAIYDSTGGPGASVSLVNTQLSANIGGSGAGGALSVRNGSLVNCTVSENTAVSPPGGIFHDGGTLTVTNSILWDNGGTSESDQLVTGGTATVTYSTIQGLSAFAGTGNLASDPLLQHLSGPDGQVGTVDDFLVPADGSPVIDAGNTAALPADAFDADGDSDTGERIPVDLGLGSRVVDDPATPNTGVGSPPTVDMGAFEFQAFIDCNNNAIEDSQDIANCSGDPSCDDCNNNLVPDGCDIDNGASDCQFNGIPDACEIGETSLDCNGNTIPDECDLAACTTSSPDFPGCDDCNNNLILDSCDIAFGPSTDLGTCVGGPTPGVSCVGTGQSTCGPGGMCAGVDGVPDECVEYVGGCGTPDWSCSANWLPTLPDAYPDNGGSQSYSVNIGTPPALGWQAHSEPDRSGSVTAGAFAATVDLDLNVEINSLRLFPDAQLNVNKLGPVGDLVIASNGLRTDGELRLGTTRKVTVLLGDLEVAGRLTASDASETKVPSGKLRGRAGGHIDAKTAVAGEGSSNTAGGISLPLLEADLVKVDSEQSLPVFRPRALVELGDDAVMRATGLEMAVAGEMRLQDRARAEVTHPGGEFFALDGALIRKHPSATLPAESRIEAALVRILRDPSSPLAPARVELQDLMEIFAFGGDFEHQAEMVLRNNAKARASGPMYFRPGSRLEAREAATQTSAVLLNAATVEATSFRLDRAQTTPVALAAARAELTGASIMRATSGPITIAGELFLEDDAELSALNGDVFVEAAGRLEKHPSATAFASANIEALRVEIQAAVTTPPLARGFVKLADGMMMSALGSDVDIAGEMKVRDNVRVNAAAAFKVRAGGQFGPDEAFQSVVAAPVVNTSAVQAQTLVIDPLQSGPEFLASGRVDLSEDMRLDLTGDAMIAGRLFLGDRAVVSAPAGLMRFMEGALCSRRSESLSVATARIEARDIDVEAATTPGLTSAELNLDQQMSLRTFGNFRLLGNPPAFVTAGVTPPPKFSVYGSTLIQVDGAMSLTGVAECVNASTNAVELGGDWDNRLLMPSLFDWTAGQLRMNFPPPIRTFEVAGIDLGPTLEGFDTDADTLHETNRHPNFSMNSLEIAANSVVIFQNGFANTMSTDPCAEALYVRTLTKRAGAQLMLDNVRVYVESFVDDAPELAVTLIGPCAELVSLGPPNLVWNPDSSSSARGTRSLTVSASATATGGSGTSAIRVELVDLQNPDPANPPCCQPPNFSTYESATCTAGGEGNGCARWVGPAVTIREAQDNVALGTFVAARLQCTPYYTDWTTLGSIKIVGPEILPSSTLELTAYGSSCKGVEGSCTNLSTPVQATTRRSGDVAPPYAPTGTQPDPQDVVAVLNKFKNQPGAPGKAIAQIQPNVIELNVDVGALDIVATIDAFRGVAYPFSGPCPCPSLVTCNATACGPPACAGGGLCVKTCSGGTNAGQPCLNDNHCPGSICPSTGFCRDRCGRCRD